MQNKEYIYKMAKKHAIRNKEKLGFGYCNVLLAAASNIIGRKNPKPFLDALKSVSLSNLELKYLSEKVFELFENRYATQCQNMAARTENVRLDLYYNEHLDLLNYFESLGFKNSLLSYASPYIYFRSPFTLYLSEVSGFNFEPEAIPIPDFHNEPLEFVSL